jgi:hypothetical protein
MSLFRRRALSDNAAQAALPASSRRRLRRDSPGQAAYATWASGDVDAYLQQTLSAPRTQVRLVIRRRIVKKGDQL